jgi:hypothetical protein
MPCSRYREAIGDRAAGGAAGAEVDAHLAACAACRSELEELRAALRLADATLAELLAEEPRSGLRGEILVATATAAAGSDTASDAGRTRPPLGWKWPGAIFAGGALLAAALLLALSERSSGPVPGQALAPALGEVSVPRDETPRSREAAPNRTSTPSARRVRSTAREEPEVLVPPEEAEGVWRLASALQGRVVGPGSLLTSDVAAPLAEARAIDLVPVDVVALPSSDAWWDAESLEEGERP